MYIIMSFTVKPTFNRTSNTTCDSHEKTHWCLAALCMHLNSQGYEIIGTPYCRFQHNCYNAHKETDIKKNQLVDKWASIQDFSQFDIGKKMDNILTVLDKARAHVNNPKYVSGITNMNTLNFVELCSFWYEITCYHRKIAKNLPSHRQWHDHKSSPMPIDKYHFKEDVPTFALENEDDIWALERTMHLCPQYAALITTRHAHSKDICCGSFNCKHGVHRIEDIICTEDLMNGTCSCMKQEDIDHQVKQIELDVINYKRMLHTSTDADGFTIRLTKNIKEEIQSELKEKINTLQTIVVRKRHLTEFGLVPLKVHFENKQKIIKSVEEAVEVVFTKKIIKKQYT